jgi:hypothetical protein
VGNLPLPQEGDVSGVSVKGAAAVSDYIIYDIYQCILCILYDTADDLCTY